MLAEKKTLSIWPDVGKELGVGRTKAYELARKPGFPVLVLGHKKVVPKKALEKWIERELKENGFSL